MEWSTLANFGVQWQAPKDLKNQDNPNVPKLTKSASITKWIESFKLHMNTIVGVMNCPLVYVVQEKYDLANVTRGNLMAGQPHSEENGSLEAELVQITSHNHPLFRNDNGGIYHKMERSLSGSNYSSTIVQFLKNREGDKAFNALVYQHAGKPVWEKRIKDAETYLMNRK